jgi:hypothetical protein
MSLQYQEPHTQKCSTLSQKLIKQIMHVLHLTRLYNIFIVVLLLAAIRGLNVPSSSQYLQET